MQHIYIILHLSPQRYETKLHIGISLSTQAFWYTEYTDRDMGIIHDNIYKWKHEFMKTHLDFWYNIIIPVTVGVV